MNATGNTGTKMKLNFAATLADQMLGTDVPAEVAIEQLPIKPPTISPEDVDPKELEKGTEDEMEHTDYRDVAEIIALHHLANNPTYYSDLEKAGLMDEPSETDISETENTEWAVEDDGIITVYPDVLNRILRERFGIIVEDWNLFPGAEGMKGNYSATSSDGEVTLYARNALAQFFNQNPLVEFFNMANGFIRIDFNLPIEMY